MPWSLKASGLLRSQYAAVGAASGAVFPGALAALEGAAARGVAVKDLLDRQRARSADAAAFTDAYRRYCWPTEGLDGVRLAPFQILAVQGRSLAALPHDEQLALLDRLVEHDGSGLLQTTRRLYVDTGDPESVSAGVDWWLEMTGRGGGGMVVKPVGALVRDDKARLVQPGIKCRGREYLRIIYGPEYTRPDNLARLRHRFLNHKRSLAVREYALGLEALDRLADGEPLWRVHEAVFGVLALESERWTRGCDLRDPVIGPRRWACAGRCHPAYGFTAVDRADSGRRSRVASRAFSSRSGWVRSVVARAMKTRTV